MKVYDTDEAAIAKAARQRMLIRVITIIITLLMSAVSIAVMMKLFHH